MITRKPELDASDELWKQYAKDSCFFLESRLGPFLREHFGYTERSVKRSLNVGLGSTVCAYARKYDLYLRLFPRPQGGWPRETIVLARILFREERKGHGRSLLSLLAGLTPEIGYHHIAIECANDNSRAFGKRFGLQTIDDGRNWLGTVSDVERALQAPTIA